MGILILDICLGLSFLDGNFNIITGRRNNLKDRGPSLNLDMLDNIMRRTLDQLIDRTTISFHTVMSSIRIEKAEFHIQSESDYAIGLAHGMILTGFLSDFKTHNNREPNQEEMIEVRFFLIEIKN